METQLAMDSKSKRLNVIVKKRYEHDSGVQLKVRGVLDTQEATGKFQASLNKFFRLGKLSVQDAFTADTRLRLGVGTKGSSEFDELHFTVSAKKKLELNKRTETLRNRTVLRGYTHFVLDANYDYNLRSEKWAGEATARATHVMFGFTEGQDLRVSAGYRAQFNQRGITKKEPFLRVNENNWGLLATWGERGQASWMLTYDL